MNAILAVVGKDDYGILAKVSSKCSDYKASVFEVSQKIISGYFTMVMIVNIDNLSIDFNDFVDAMEDFGKEENLKINVMHEDIFNLMHKI